MKTKEIKSKTSIRHGYHRKNYRRLVIYLVLLAILVAVMILINKFVDRLENEAEQGPVESMVVFKREGVLEIIDNEGNEVKNLEIEIADTEYDRNRGLMYRTYMPDNAGMLFIFDGDAPRSFWMKNTPLSLDIIYINSGMEIVTIQKNTVPYSEASVPSFAPARYVLEVNAGFSEIYGLKEGYRIRFEYTSD